jgi:uncharacterized protein YukE
MYQAKSVSTLQLYQLHGVPSAAGRLEELGEIYDGFEQSIHDADCALHAGRALSAQFQREALQGAGYERLQTLVDQMHSKYTEYQLALNMADDYLNHIDFYVQSLAQTHSIGGERTGGNAIHAA